MNFCAIATVIVTSHPIIFRTGDLVHNKELEENGTSFTHLPVAHFPFTVQYFYNESHTPLTPFSHVSHRGARQVLHMTM